MSKNIYFAFYLLLLSPILGFTYSVIFELPKSISFAFAFYFFLLGIWFLFRKRNIYLPNYALLLLLFATYKCIWTVILNLDKHFLTTVYDIILFFAISFIIIIIYNSSFSKRFVDNSILIFQITLIVAAIVSIIQVYNLEFLNTNYYLKQDDATELFTGSIYILRRHSIFGFVGANAIGLAFLPLLSITIGYLVRYTSKKYIVYLIAGAIIAFLSNARYIMIGFIIITLQLVLSGNLRISGYLRYFVSTIGLLVVLYFVFELLNFNLQEWFEQRLFHEGSIKNTTRFKAINTFIVYFPQNPIFGTGYQTEEIREFSRTMANSSHIHVGYLSHLVNYGIIGCFFLFGSWFLLLKRMLANALKTRYWGSLFGFLTFLWAFATMSQPSFLYYGLIFMMIFDKYTSDITNQTDIYRSHQFTNSIIAW